jgi:HAD superfamily hydrolase (TIGR01549 family)
VAWHRAFNRYGTPPPLWRVHRTIGMGGDKLVAEVTDEDTEERLGDQLREAWQEEYRQLSAEVRPLPGATALVADLREAGVRVALASSGEAEFAEQAVELLGIGDHLEAVVTAADVDASKPDPDLLQVTLDRLDGVERAFFVGDTVYDVEAASKAGLPCLTVRTGGFGRAELEAAGAALVVDSLDELREGDWQRHLRPVERRSS